MIKPIIKSLAIGYEANSFWLQLRRRRHKIVYVFMDSLSEMSKIFIDKVTPNWLATSIQDDTDDNGNPVTTTSFPIKMKGTKLADLEDRILIKILRFVNYSDLAQCRIVNKRFFEAISHSSLFLSSTLFVVSVKPDYETDSSFLDSPIPYQHVRFQYIDYEVYLKQKKFDDLSSGNYYFRPPTPFLNNLRSLEFHNCFITWETIKRIINEAFNLQQFSLTRCQFTDQYRGTNAVLGEFDEFRVGSIFSTLKTIKIQEHEHLRPLNKILEKLLGYSAKFLEKIFISFDPIDVTGESSENLPAEEKDIDAFCDFVRRLIESNVSTLKTLAMDLKYRPLLNIICPKVFSKMDNLWEELELEEFILSPPGCTPTPNPVDITQNGLSSAQILSAFLESQVHLKKAAIPHIRNMGNGQEKHYRTKVACSLPSSTEYLCIPNQEYLVRDFTKRLPNLKKLYIGGSTSDDGFPVPLRSEMFEDTRAITYQPNTLEKLDLPMALSGSQLMMQRKTTRNVNLDQIVELGIGSTIINGIELMKIIKKFNFVVKFEVTSQLPVIQDDDLQCCIESMPWLQYLGISSCDFLTDYGITGILRNSCEMMVRLNNYHGVDDSILEARGNTGKPLSLLKGLRNLVLMGKSHITDVGIHFGLRFQELQTVCLPYNENITEWGIRQFGNHNPSLQVFVSWSLNSRSKEGFINLQETHPRVRKNKCTFLSYVNDGTPNDYSSSLVKFDILKNAIATSMSGMCSSFNFAWLFGGSSNQSPSADPERLEEEPTTEGGDNENVLIN